MTDVAFAGRFAVLLEMSGMTVATCTAAPLLTEFDVTIAVRLPAAVGSVVNVTVSEVAVAEVTTPSAPLLKITVLFDTIGSKPDPLITTSDATAEMFAVDCVTLTALNMTRFSRNSSERLLVCGYRLRTRCRRDARFGLIRPENSSANQNQRFIGILNLSTVEAVRELSI